MRWRPERGWTLLLVRLAALVGSLVFLVWSAASTPAVLSPGARPSETVRDVDEGSPAEERRLVDLVEQQRRQDAVRDAASGAGSAEARSQPDDDAGNGDEGDEGDEP